MANDRDPRSDLGAWLGEELRRARLDAGFTSQDQLACELGFDRTVIVKAETGARPPSEDVAPMIAEMFPGLCNGLYVRLAAIARKSNGPIPGWFADWLGRERVTYTGIMSVQREELLRLVEELPEEEVPAVLDDVRRHLRSVRERPWPPAWFGAGEGSADDVAARSEDLLRDGFGRSA